MSCIDTLMQLSEAHLLIISYKLCDNHAPVISQSENVGTRKAQLSALILKALGHASAKLNGETLPANWDVIKTLMPLK